LPSKSRKGMRFIKVAPLYHFSALFGLKYGLSIDAFYAS
jgi:hypothetical protein